VPEYIPPPRSAFTRSELAVIDGHKTPRAVQHLLDYELGYDHHRVGTKLRSFRYVLREGETHCMEAALVAAVVLEQHGYPPLIVSLESQDGLDHILFVYKHRGRWGAVARSRDAGLHGRKPVFRSIRDLVWSYFDPYVDWTGRLTGYALVDLREVGTHDWRFNKRNLWWLERFLFRYPHTRMRSSRARYRRLLRRFLAYRERHPHGPVTFYPGRERWLSSGPRTPRSVRAGRRLDRGGPSRRGRASHGA
jgi:hypothetical protein